MLPSVLKRTRMVTHRCWVLYHLAGDDDERCPSMDVPRKRATLSEL